MEKNYLMIIAAVLLFFFLVYQEIRRVNRDRLFLRLLAVFLAAGALVMLAFPWKYKVQRDTDAHELRLLTKGVDLSGFKEHVYFTTDSGVLLTARKNVKYIPDLAYYLQAHQDISRIKVYGYGLRVEELRGLKDYTFDFEPSPSPEGFVSCSWPQKIKQTTSFAVQGVYNNTKEEPVKLILKGLGTNLDSIIVNAHTKGHFSLTAQGRQLGKTTYNLSALSNRDTLFQEKVPFQVISSPKLKLLILSSFPDFEYKFLKNWLFENKFQVVYRTRVSKDKFSIDQLNMPAVNAATLNAELLGHFDLVIADDEELAALDASTVSSMRQAVNNGLGLLIRMNDDKALSVFTKQFKLYQTTDSNARSFTPILADGAAGLRPTPGVPFFDIQPQPGEQPLVKNQAGKVLLSSALYGNGKVAVSTISSTYHWILSGEQSDYAQFWSAVISAAARKEEAASNWNIVSGLPVASQQTAIVYESNTTQVIPSLTINHQVLSSIQHNTLPFIWKGTFWPGHMGWNELKIDNNPAEYFYIYGNQDWQAVKQQKSMLENLVFSQKSHVAVKNKEIMVEIIEKEVSNWWFFAIFLLAAGYIWFETKLL